MGNYRFKLSDMMPNAWFYKLRDNMGGGTTTRNQTSSTTTRKKKQQSCSQNSTTTTTTLSSKPKCNPRKSYYFTRELNHTSPAKNNLNISETNFTQQPRKSPKQKPKKKTPKTSSFSSSSPVNISEEESEEFHDDPEIRTDRVLLPSVEFDEKISTLCSNNDIIINVDNNSIAKKDDDDDVFDSFSKLMMLPPIVTKPEKFNDFLNDAKKKEITKGSLKVKILKKEEQRKNNNGRRFSVNSPGVKLRINSPRIGSRKVQLQPHGRKSVTGTGTGTGGYRRSLSDSLAIVKSSVNPQRDFRESMVEMIVQNNIRSSKDLEDLLACYLSLNSDEYHDVIIKVFKQIWFDLTDNQ